MRLIFFLNIGNLIVIAKMQKNAAKIDGFLDN